MQDTKNNIDIISIKILLFDHNSVVKQADWCRKCLELYGLIEPYKPEKIVVKTNPPPTIEDIIIELIREENKK